MKEILKKHILISMSNGHVLEGFADQIKEDFLTLIENNNNIVLVRVSDVSFIRIGNTDTYKPETQKQYEPEEILPGPIEYEKQTKRDEDFSMPLPRPNEYVGQTEFIKRGSFR